MNVKDRHSGYDPPEGQESDCDDGYCHYKLHPMGKVPHRHFPIELKDGNTGFLGVGVPMGTDVEGDGEATFTAKIPEKEDMAGIGATVFTSEDGKWKTKIKNVTTESISVANSD